MVLPNFHITLRTSASFARPSSLFGRKTRHLFLLCYVAQRSWEFCDSCNFSIHCCSPLQYWVNKILHRYPGTKVCGGKCNCPSSQRHTSIPCFGMASPAVYFGRKSGRAEFQGRCYGKTPHTSLKSHLSEWTGIFLVSKIL